SRHFPVAVGDYWLAAGIRFSSFKLVDGFALATVQFGTRTEITLLGLAVLSQPVGTENPFVRVELALKARFSPDEGALGIVAALTPNSYLFSKDCKLTGGLAFNVWFEPTAKGAENHAGDFVITLGGYHPKLQVRPHYPTVARVGLKWLMPDKGVSVEGGVYFAVTPSFVMAGGHLSAIYQSEAVRAWFSADADFLVGWEPFSYAAEIKVRLGASATVKLLWVQETLDFELGVLFRVWGPPFSGEVKADLGVLTVTIPIGETERLDRPKPLSWATFAAKFFPRPAPGSQELRPLSVVVAAGISGERREGKVARPLVNGGELRLMVSCFVPLTEVPKGGKVTGGKPFDTKLGIRPMNARLQSSTVALQCRGPAGPVEQLEVEGTVSNLPEALWSTKPPPDPDKDELKVGVVAALSGANVKLKPRLDPLPTVEANLDETRVINTSVRSGGRQCYEHAAYVSPEKARDRFNNCVGLPRREVLEGLAAEGFSFAGGDLRLRHDQLQIRNSGHSMLYAVPELVPLGKLRAQVAG
ncbi:MAG: hypothetical protein HY985_16180, partial [Magnetospirillum sp.]|nr:hypothetical protein [Magnetospirillum sp.]